MKTEEILRYESEFKAMQDALGTSFLVFDFPREGTLIRVEDRRDHEWERLSCNYIAKETKDTNFA